MEAEAEAEAVEAAWKSTASTSLPVGHRGEPLCPVYPRDAVNFYAASTASASIL